MEKYELPFDWQLNCDEESILTQDIHAPDRTFKNLKKQQINIGEKYSKHIEDVIKILKGLEDDLSKKSNKNIYNWNLLATFKNLMEEYLEKYFDMYTYEILSNPNGNMRYKL